MFVVAGDDACGAIGPTTATVGAPREVTQTHRLAGSVTSVRRVCGTVALILSRARLTDRDKNSGVGPLARRLVASGAAEGGHRLYTK